MGGIEREEMNVRERKGERYSKREAENTQRGWSKEREVPLVLALMPVQRDCMGGVTGR